MSLNTNLQLLVTDIAQIIHQGRGLVRQTINTVMVESYWQIGRLIIEHEQNGEARAEYGKQQLQYLSTQLTEQFGKGFDVGNLRNMRQFYQTYPIRDAVRSELSWTHYRYLMRIENPQARDWYARETISQSWSVRALERQISVLYYERLLASKDKMVVESEAAEQTSALAETAKDYLRDPYILDFLNLPDHDNIDVPIIEKKIAQVLSIHDTTANVMDAETFETFDLKIPEDLQGVVVEGNNIQYWVILNDRVMKAIKPD